jgi:ADP-ribose pyrophosphatase YjhB (NUDIX family)
MKIRVRAIILDNKNNIIVIKRKKLNNPVYWVFPGGGVEKSDNSLEEALKRECLEEIGVIVSVDKLFMEYNFNENKEYFYICSIISGIIGTGDGPEYKKDNNYISTFEVEKYKISDIEKINLKPEEVKNKFLLCKNHSFSSPQ